MGLKNVKKGKLLYHLTCLKNLDSIIKNGILSRAQLDSKDVIFSDVADDKILCKRACTYLDNYVPFHFHPYTSFAYKTRNQHPTDDFIFICIKRSYAKCKQAKIVPQHPLSMEQIELLDFESGMRQIDWNLMSFGNEENCAKQVKMAECLIENVVYSEDFCCIYVKNAKVKTQVEQIFANNNIKYMCYINIEKRFFS